MPIVLDNWAKKNAFLTHYLSQFLHDTQFFSFNNIAVVTLVEIPTKVSLLFSVVCVPTIYTSTIVHSLVLTNASNKGCSNYIKTRVLHLSDVSKNNSNSVVLSYSIVSYPF